MDVGLLCAIYDKNENMIYIYYEIVCNHSVLFPVFMSQQLLTRGAQISPR